MDFIGPHWNQELPLPCHLTVNWEAQNSQVRAMEAPLCFGLLTMMRNSAKMPRTPEIADAVRGVERNTDEFFSHLGEFVQHHGSSDE